MRALPFLLATVLIGCSETPREDEPLQHAIVITIDTLRADRLGVSGYEAASTPRIDALAAESIRFENARAHSSMTAPSLASLLSGTLPARHGVVNNQTRLPGDVPTLATDLERAGFSTAAFLGNFALRESQGFQRGFETRTERFETHEAVRRHPENLAGPLTDRAIEWLHARSPEERIFLWVHYQEPHGPYTPPGFAPPATDGPVLPRNETNSGSGGIPRYQWLGHGRSAEYAARYDGEIAEVDRHVGRLVDHLRDRGLLDRSILVLTADHGEALGEDDLWFAHGEGLSDELLRVPLLVRLPGRSGEVRSDPVRLVDVAPTIHEALGRIPGKGDGTSLLARDVERPLVAQVQDWRLIRDGAVQVLLRGDAAPEVVAGEPVSAERLAELTGRLEAQAPVPRRNEAPLTPAEREALRALGYVD